MSTIAASVPVVPPLRSRRKCAKAAAAFVAATVKDEMLIPDEPVRASPSHKRSYSRATSHGSAASAASTAGHSPANKALKRSASNGGGGSSQKKKTALSTYAVEYLKAWMMSPDHIEHPYPTEDEKALIMSDTGIELKQLTNWFVNNRKRYWKPKVEELRRQMGSGNCNVSLQEMAAAAQAANGGSIRAAAAMAAGVGNQASSGMVSTSEGEESSSGRERKSSGGSNKKRKKYSTVGGNKQAATAAPGTAKATRNSKKAKEEKSQLQTTLVANPMTPGIHTALTHESVKAARKLSHESAKAMKVYKVNSVSSARLISETSSNEESEESDVEERGKKLRAPSMASTAGVSDPLAVPVPPVASVITQVPIPTLAQAVSASGVLTTDQVVAGMDCTIDPLDDEVANPSSGDASAAANQAAADAAVVAGMCCTGVMPHSCNLADPMGAKNRFAQPCALCSACRDWNLGEFCPWDLTGIIGDISTEGMEIPDTAPVDAEAAPLKTLDSTASTGTMDGSTHGTETVTTALTKASAVTSSDIEPTPAVSIPQEIHHSTSAADFMSSMADIESWD